MRPTHLPELRLDMLDALQAPSGREIWHMINKGGFFGVPAMPGQVEQARSMEIDRWSLGDLYFVTSEMAYLAKVAAKSMPRFQLLPSDLPSSRGVIYFEGGLGLSAPMSEIDDRAVPRVPVVAVAWGPLHITGKRSDGTTELQHKLWLSFYTDKSGTPGAREARAGGEGPLAYENETAIPFTINTSEQPTMYIGGEASGDLMDHAQKDNVLGWPFTVITTWLLMQQQVARVDEVPMDRASRRRLAHRHRDEVNPVRVITLRHQSSVGAGDGSREFYHRWMVKGHWRNQWYPSQKRHVPIWISPHIKGPEGAPLLGGEKVYAWTR